MMWINNRKAIMRKHSQSGFTLLELTIALAISMMVLGYSMYARQIEMRESYGKTQGEVLANINAAVDAYQTKYYGNLVAGTAITGVATPLAPTVAELQTIGLLTASTSNTPLNGGNYVVGITRNPNVAWGSSCGTNCNISGLVYLSNPLLRSGNPDGVVLGSAVEGAGGNAGFSSAATGGTIDGAGWSIANPAGNVPGTLAMQSGYAASAMDVFYRRDGSRPLTGALNMGAQKITGLLTAVATSGCTTTGDLAQAADGSVLSCQGGTWQQQGSAYWKDPVLNAAALSAIVCNALNNVGQTRVIQAPSVGSGPRAYTCSGASGWQPLAINDSGDITVPGTVTTSKLAGNLQVTATAAEGAACTGEGRIAASTTTSGLLLSCQSGFWAKATGSVGTYYGFVQSAANPVSVTFTLTSSTTVKLYVSSSGWSANQPLLYQYAKCDSDPWVAISSASDPNGGATIYENTSGMLAVSLSAGTHTCYGKAPVWNSLFINQLMVF